MSAVCAVHVRVLHIRELVCILIVVRITLYAYSIIYIYIIHNITTLLDYSTVCTLNQRKGAAGSSSSRALPQNQETSNDDQGGDRQTGRRA